MKIFSAAQIKKWDAFTILNEPVAAVDLMERAASKCVDWITQQNYLPKHFHIFCGKGNNGGDGLAIARMLIKKNYVVTVYILEFGNIGTADFQTNLARLHECSTNIHFIQSIDFFPVINNQDIIIDALFGMGLNKPLEGISAALVNYINGLNACIISIDIPSGLYADTSSQNNSAIKATYTLSFQNYKLAFLVAENESYCGNLHLLDIGLDKKFEAEENAAFEMTDRHFIQSIYKPRKKFAHKGNFGHATLLCGSYGMMGAAVLSAKACLRSGAGKLNCYVPKCGYEIMQISVPEAMCTVAGENYITIPTEIEKFNAIGMGPGLGRHKTHASLLKTIFQTTATPVLIDADALNTMGEDKSLLALIPKHAVITPHPKEFDNLFGKSANDFERMQLAIEKAKEFKTCIVLKGHYTLIATPDGKGYFNNTGNAGMATAGSGDILSGIITGLLAQGYNTVQASLLGTYMHGLAGDFAAAKYSQEAMIAGDITDELGEAFKTLI